MTSLGTGVCAVAAVVALAMTGCSGDDGGGGEAEPAGASPTAVGDAALVRVLEAGGEPRRVLRLAVEDGDRTTSALVLDQEIENDGRVRDTPSITFPFDTEVTDTSDDEITATQTFGAVEVDSAEIEDALAAVAGVTGSLTLRTDGTVVASTLDLADDAPAAATLEEVRNQVRSLVPVFPGDEVGAGATWTVGSVVDVDGATVDQTATYTLDSIEDDAYVVGVTVTQEYRAGTVDGVEVTRGGASWSGRFAGSLTAALPSEASLDATTNVTYAVGDSVTEVRTTIAARLTEAPPGAAARP